MSKTPELEEVWEALAKLQQLVDSIVDKKVQNETVKLSLIASIWGIKYHTAYYRLLNSTLEPEKDYYKHKNEYRIKVGVLEKLKKEWEC